MRQEIIARAKIPTEILTNFPAPNVDTSIFRHGTLTIDIGNMDLLNHSIWGNDTNKIEEKINDKYQQIL